MTTKRHSYPFAFRVRRPADLRPHASRAAAHDAVEIEEGPRHRPGDPIACQQADALYLRLRALAREIGPAAPEALLAEYRRGSALPSQLSERHALRVAADAHDAWEREVSR